MPTQPLCLNFHIHDSFKVGERGSEAKRRLMQLESACQLFSHADFQVDDLTLEDTHKLTLFEYLHINLNSLWNIFMHYSFLQHTHISHFAKLRFHTFLTLISDLKLNIDREKAMLIFYKVTRLANKELPAFMKNKSQQEISSWLSNLLRMFPF